MASSSTTTAPLLLVCPAKAEDGTTTTTTTTNCRSTSATTAKNGCSCRSTPAAAPTTTTSSITNEDVQEYYGKTLQSSNDLQTNACTTGASMPSYIKQKLSNIHPTVLSKYYGCGLCIPNYDLDGAAVLDLGCGAGRDVYLVSQLVGPKGSVVGIDMTVEQLNVAKEYLDYHTEAFGYKQPNVRFVQGYLEQLDEMIDNGVLQANAFDLIISNCVINLCTDKRSVLESCYKLLKPGGELYFSDVYSNRRVPKVLQDDKVLWGECISGALYWNDFHSIAKSCGFIDPRLVDAKPITIKNPAVAALFDSTGNGSIEFYSATYRLQKLDTDVFESGCEDYGLAVTYKGTIGNSPTLWTLDKHHVFEVGMIHPVCGNTFNILLGNPRIRDHFDFIGTFDKHYGIFDSSGPSIPYDRSSKQQCCW